MGIQVDHVRPLAGLTVVLVFGTGLVAGIQLSHPPDQQQSTAAPASTPPPPGPLPPSTLTIGPVPPPAPTQPTTIEPPTAQNPTTATPTTATPTTQPPPSGAEAAPTQPAQPQIGPSGPESPSARVPFASPPPVAAAPRLPSSTVIRRPTTPGPAQVAQSRAAQRHAEAYARLRRQAIRVCRELGFSQARCNTAPK